MRRNLSWASVKVGIVITSALVTVFLVVLFSDTLLSVFVDRERIWARIEHARGLRAGSPVWLHGIEVGKVGDVRLNESGSLIGLEVAKKYFRYIGKGSKAGVYTIGLLGDKYVEIIPGDTVGATIDPGDTLAGTTAGSIEEIIEASTQSIQQVNRFIQRLDTLIGGLGTQNGNLHSFIHDTSLYANLDKTAGAIATILEDYQEGNGTLKRLVTEDDLYRTLLSAGRTLGRVADAARDTSGALGTLLYDEELKRDFVQSLKGIERFVEKMNTDSSTAGMLLQDDELARNLQRMIDNLRAITEDIKNNPKDYFNLEIF
jgi:phospholipid/cholesterol/gamma-HCH transport system substrate-binding protein